MRRIFTRLENSILSRNYWLLKRIKYGRYRKQHAHDKFPLIIYQMGKVGSSTIVNSLKNLSLNYTVYQVHVLTDEWISRVHGQYKRASRIHGRPMLDTHLLASMYLREKLDGGHGERKWKVISLVRDPVARNISCFFQAFPVYFPGCPADMLSDGERVGELVDLFMEKFEEHETPLEWFDTHMKPVFGIDVFAEPFPWEKGYKIYEGDEADLLVMRLEDLDACAARAFREFIGVDGFRMTPDNVSGGKQYAEMYRLFRRQAVIPRAMLEKMYGSRYMTHFYSREEIGRFVDKWTSSAMAETKPGGGGHG